MTTISWTDAGAGRRHTYSPVAESAVPESTRFDVPRQMQGQVVEYAFGGSRGAGESDVGDKWMRVRDASDRTTTYYRRTRTVAIPQAAVDAAELAARRARL